MESTPRSESPNSSASETRPSVLDQILENDEPQKLPTRIDGLQVGTITGFDDAGFPLVSVPGLIETPIVAAAICDFATLEIGAQCALMFQSGSPSSPVIMGIFTQPLVTLGNSSNVQIYQDENELGITADQEINLHCGQAHLRLTADGRIELRGKTIVSHSTGLNRIRGASVKLN